VALLIGGVSFDDQNRKLERGADVLIATPGRLLDHFERGKLLLTGVEILVIDEADRMLDMGFIPDIERICKDDPVHAPDTVLLGHDAAGDHAPCGPVPASARSRRGFTRRLDGETVQQKLLGVSKKDFEKRAALRDLIRGQDNLKNGIIFCNRKRDVSELFRSLDRTASRSAHLHGDMDQKARMATLDKFRSTKSRSWPPATSPRAARYSRRQPRVQLRCALAIGRLRSPHRAGKKGSATGRAAQIEDITRLLSNWPIASNRPWTCQGLHSL
jgi:hypothetical protein